MNRPRFGDTNIVVLGAGGTGLFMADCIRQAEGFAFAGFLDDDPQKQTGGYEDHAVLGGLTAWRTLPASCLFITSLYSPKKMYLWNARVEELGIPDGRWATFVDPLTRIGSGVHIGKGTFVGPGTVIEPACTIGRCCALLGSVHLAHHVVLEDYVVCANSVSISGGVSIGRGSYVGANAAVRQYVRIGPFAVVGMGAVVLDAVSGATTVVGNPARPMG